MTRRTLLQSLAAPLLLGAERSLRCDVAVIGGGFGGCAAALGALRNGMRVVMTEETDWIGGQVTSQAVPPDEHPWIESFGGTRAYREYRSAVREYYKRNYPLTAEARRRAFLNPGDGSVSKLTHEPRVSLAVLEDMLAPYVSGGWLTVLLRHEPVAADVDGDRVRGVRLKSLDTGTERVIEAFYFLDATEQGDLLPLARVEYVTGFEASGEPHAPSQAQPANIQSFTVCFAMDYRKGEDHTIDKPEDYAFWRDYVPQLKPAWPGKLLSWSMANPQTHEIRKVVFDPEVENPSPGFLNLWMYRRIASAKNFVAGAYGSDITLVNWPQNDYWLGNLHRAYQPLSAVAAQSASQSKRPSEPRPQGAVNDPEYAKICAAGSSSACHCSTGCKRKRGSRVSACGPTSRARRTGSRSTRTSANRAGFRRNSQCSSSTSAPTLESLSLPLKCSPIRSASAAIASICTRPQAATTMST